MFKVNNEDIKTTSLTLFAVFIVNVEHISHLCLVLFLFCFFALNRQMFPATLYYLIVIMEAATSTFDNIFRK